MYIFLEGRKRIGSWVSRLDRSVVGKRDERFRQTTYANVIQIRDGALAFLACGPDHPTCRL